LAKVTPRLSDPDGERRHIREIKGESIGRLIGMQSLIFLHWESKKFDFPPLDTVGGVR
jgi:hypothetical protein